MPNVCEDSVKKIMRDGSIQCGFYINDMLQKCIDYEKARVDADWDSWYIVDGEEGCISGDTLIKTCHGDMALKDIKRPNINLYAYVMQRNVSKKVTARIINTGIKKTFTLKLENGAEVRATEDHTFFIKKLYMRPCRYSKVPRWMCAETQLKDIKVGDEMLIHDTPFWNKVVSITEYGEEQTFDLKVPKYHNFILSNNIVTHNSGKSNLASSVCYYYASLSGIKFTLNDVFYTVQQFYEWLETAPPGAAGMWDEFVLGGLSSDALTSIQNTLIKKAAMIRRKRLFIVLVIPSIFMMRKYFAMHRAHALLHVTSADNLTRGVFWFYSKPAKKYLYVNGIKYWEYKGTAKYDFDGVFQNYKDMFYDNKEYQEKKEAATKGIENKDEKEEEKEKTKLEEKEVPKEQTINKEEYRLYKLIEGLHKLGITYNSMAKIIEMPSITFIQKRAEWNEKFNIQNPPKQPENGLKILLRSSKPGSKSEQIALEKIQHLTKDNPENQEVESNKI